MTYHFYRVHSTVVGDRENTAGTTQRWVVSRQTVLDGPPFFALVLCQDVVVENRLN